MSAITYLGEWWLVPPVVLVLSLLFWHYRQSFLILPLWFATGGAMIVTHILKTLVERPRPELGLLVEHTPSFPSGHATIAISLYGFIAWYIWRCERRRGTRADVPLLVVLIALIGLSRLYLGVHYLTDVLGGFFIGGVFLFVAIAIVKLLLRDNDTRAHSFHWAHVKGAGRKCDVCVST